jgi:hypothetical protein
MKQFIHKNIIIAMAFIFISPAPQFRPKKSNHGEKTFQQIIEHYQINIMFCHTL